MGEPPVLSGSAHEMAISASLDVEVEPPDVRSSRCGADGAVGADGERTVTSSEVDGSDRPSRLRACTRKRTRWPVVTSGVRTVCTKPPGVEVPSYTYFHPPSPQSSIHSS